MDKSDPAYAGQAGYTRAFLAIYDAWVIGVVAPRFLKTPSQRRSPATANS